MTTTVCSGFSPLGHREYGDTFLRSWALYWPDDVELEVYTERPVALSLETQHIHIRSLWDCRGIADFLARHQANLAAQGRQPARTWKPGDVRRGYSFRFDAVKFSRQCVIPLQASRALADGDILAWMDADVVTFKTPPRGFIAGLLGDADACYLGRGRKHSEIGFWAVRLGPKMRDFLEMLAAAYVEDRVFSMGEWHSAYVWDSCRFAFEAAGLKFKNLTPNAGVDHVWHRCDLGLYTDHLKGDRKRLGRSPERRN